MAKQLSMDRAFETIGYKPHNLQREVHAMQAYHRFLVACFGRRTGKSNMGGHRLTVEAMRARHRRGLSGTGRRAEYWIVGPEYSDGEKEFRVLYDDLKRMGAPMDHPGTYYSPDSGQMDLSMYDGKFQVHVKSAKYPNTLVGEALEGVILAEAAKLKPIVWTKFIRPMLADYHGWAFISSTPEGKNWFYDAYMRGQDPDDENWGSKRAPSWSNNILFPIGRYDPEIVDMGKDMTDESFAQEIGAEFTEYAGRVFKRFNEDDNVITAKYDPRLPLYVAADYGFRNPNVLLFVQVDPWDNVYVIGEYYKRERTTPEMVQDVKDDDFLRPLMEKATDLYGDPAGPNESAILSDAFQLKIHGGTGGEVEERVGLIRRWLKPQPAELEDGHPDKKPKLFIDRHHCPETIRDFNDYRYPERKSEQTEAKEKPLKVDDHSPEALGRMFKVLWGDNPEFKPKRRARQSTASMRR